MTILFVSIPALALFLVYALFLLRLRKGIDTIAVHKHPRTSLPFVSIIVPFRNESETILTGLRSLTQQIYPQQSYEILYVDDHSTDDSVKKLEEAEKPENVRILSYTSGDAATAQKKHAIAYAVEQAKGEIIVGTDADCLHGKEWLRSIVSEFGAETGFVSGPVIFRTSEGVFGKIQQLEFAGLILVGAGLIGINKPTLCSGANIAYRKKAFEEVGGFSSHSHLSSGDDELLMQQIARETPHSVSFCWDAHAVVSTPPNPSIGAFLRQRQRWASKGLHYSNPLLVLLLFALYALFLSFPALLLFSVFVHPYYFFLFLTLFFGKALIDYSVLTKGVPILYETFSVSIFIIAEFFHIPYILFAGAAGSLGSIEWKGRSVKR